MAVEVRLLGPLEVVRDGIEVALPGLKSRSLLATLALNGGEVVSVDRLADVMWLDSPPQTLMTQIHAQISALRHRLDPDHQPGAAGERFATRPPGYRLNPEVASIDLRRFEAALDDGREALGAGVMDAAAAAFRRGLAMWRGPALADLPRETFGGEAARLEDLRLAAGELAIEADLAGGRDRTVIAELEVMCAEHPYRETLWEKLMLALYRCGRQADALAAFRVARSGLADGLGIEPGERLRDLERAILRQDASLAAGDRTRPPGPARRVLVGGVLGDLPRLIAAAAALGDGELLAVAHVPADVRARRSGQRWLYQVLRWLRGPERGERAAVERQAERATQAPVAERAAASIHEQEARLGGYRPVQLRAGRRGRAGHHGLWIRKRRELRVDVRAATGHALGRLARRHRVLVDDRIEVARPRAP